MLSAYIDPDRQEEALPMGQEFQDFVKCFSSSSSEGRYIKASKLIEQLEWVLPLTTETSQIGMEKQTNLDPQKRRNIEKSAI